MKNNPLFSNHTFIASGELLPENLTSKFSLYNKSGFLKLKNIDYQHFYLVNNETRLLDAYWCFGLNNREAINGYQLPFGAIEFSSDIRINDLDLFVKQSLEALENMGFKKVKIRLTPDFYYQDFQPTLENLLKNYGFQTIENDVCHYLSSKNGMFEAGLHEMEKRKLKKLRSANFKATQIPLEDLEHVHSFIRRCREERNQNLSLSYDEIQLMVSNYPNNYLLVGVVFENKLVAASICTRPVPKILYHFYPASSKEFGKFSPIVLAYAFIYQYALDNGIELIDLGTSMLEDKPNKSLIKFKEHMGGIQSSKKILQLF